jgi:hypothetical protein
VRPLQISCDPLLCSEVKGRELLSIVGNGEQLPAEREEIATRKVAFGAQTGSRSAFLLLNFLVLRETRAISKSLEHD